MREYRYVVDREGRIFHDGTEIIDPPLLRFFLLGMQQTEDRRYLVMCQGERNWFEAEDTPFVVQRLQCAAPGGRLLAVELELAGDHREVLDPETLETEDDVLYCRVRRRAFRARFGRLAMQQLAPFLIDAGDGPSLLLAGARYPVRRLPDDAQPRQ
jgi:hypothetical protein